MQFLSSLTFKPVKMSLAGGCFHRINITSVDSGLVGLGQVQQNEAWCCILDRQSVKEISVILWLSFSRLFQGCSKHLNPRVSYAIPCSYGAVCREALCYTQTEGRLTGAALKSFWVTSLKSCLQGTDLSLTSNRVRIPCITFFSHCLHLWELQMQLIQQQQKGIITGFFPVSVNWFHFGNLWIDKCCPFDSETVSGKQYFIVMWSNAV